MAIMQDIIDYIIENRVSSTEVADCLGKSGVLENANAVNRGMFKVGPVRWIYGYNNSNWSIHEQARDVQRDEVVLIELFDCGDRASIGELVSKFIVLYRRAAAIVSSQKLRDGNDLIKNNYPVWCKGFTPIGTFNTKNEQPLDAEILADRKAKYDGAIAVCDDSGVVIIPPDKVTPEFLQKLHDIEEQEDIWFDMLDRKKWDTYDIVCLKKYKNL